VNQNEKEEQEIRRLWWHSRRGMLELDGLLLPFTENKFRSLSEQDKALYRRMVDSEDQDLFDWFMQKSKSSDAEIQRMIEIVLDYARNG
jgi:antitoxin CptB